MRRIFLAAASLAALATAPAAAQEAFGGIYAHEVDTPLTFDVDESGADVMLGYRFERADRLGVIGSPQPYVFGSLNTVGDTSFAGAGLSWRIETGPVFVRPGIGLVVHDGPDLRIDPVTGDHYELGSRVLFEPEIAVGVQLTEKLAAEASWVHISHARLFNWEQNPGIDTIGARLSYRFD